MRKKEQNNSKERKERNKDSCSLRFASPGKKSPGEGALLVILSKEFGWMFFPSPGTHIFKSRLTSAINFCLINQKERDLFV